MNTSRWGRRSRPLLIGIAVFWAVAAGITIYNAVAHPQRVSLFSLRSVVDHHDRDQRKKGPEGGSRTRSMSKTCWVQTERGAPPPGERSGVVRSVRQRSDATPHAGRQL